MRAPSAAFWGWFKALLGTVGMALLIALVANAYDGRTAAERRADRAEKTTEEVRNRATDRVNGLLKENQRLHEEITRLTATARRTP